MHGEAEILYYRKEFIKKIEPLISLYAIVLLVQPFLLGGLSFERSHWFLAAFGVTFFVNTLISNYGHLFWTSSRIELYRALSNFILLGLMYGALAIQGIDYWYVFIIASLGNTYGLTLQYRNSTFFFFVPTINYLVAALFFLPSGLTSENTLLNAVVLLFVSYGVHTVVGFLNKKIDTLEHYAGFLNDEKVRLKKRVSETALELRGLRKSFFDYFFESEADSVVLIDGKGLIQKYNDEFKRLLGFSDDRVGTNINQFISDPVHRLEHNAYLERYEKTGTSRIIGKGREVTGVTATGELKYLFLDVRMFNMDGTRFYLGNLRDLTAEKSRESVERHRSRLTELGEMTAGYVHELNNYAAGVNICVNLLGGLKKDFSEETLYRALGPLEKNCQKLVSLLGSIRKYSRSEAGLRESKIKVGELVQDAIYLTEGKRKGTTFTVSFEDHGHLCDIDCKPNELTQVFVNLINNASDATEGLSERWLKIWLEKDEEIQIHFQDSGSGIEESIQEKIFDKFFTTKDREKGTGLGLGVSRQIVNEHDGKIRLNKTSGNTHFVIHLPFDDSQ